MSGQRSLLAQVLDNGNSPLGLFKYLTNKWAFPKKPQYFTASRSFRSNTDSVTGAVSNTSVLVLGALGTLGSMGAEGLDKLALVNVKEDGLVSILHYLFLVGESAYKDGRGELIAIRGEIPEDGIPAIVQLEAIRFAMNSSFVGTPRLEFKGHLSSVTSSLPQDFEDSAHYPTVKGEDDVALLVKSRGLASVPCATADIALEQGLWAPISKVLSRAFTGLRLQDCVFDPSLN